MPDDVCPTPWRPPDEERVPINIHPEARDALRNLLASESFAGTNIGYSAYIMACVKRTQAEIEAEGYGRDHALRLPIASVAQRLQETLGQRLTAYAVGCRDPKAIGEIARADQSPEHKTAARLRDLYAITQTLLARESAETVRAWMIGSNPLLEDRAPIELLHEEAGQPVARAARTMAPPVSDNQIREEEDND